MQHSPVFVSLIWVSSSLCLGDLLDHPVGALQSEYSAWVVQCYQCVLLSFLCAVYIRCVRVCLFFCSQQFQLLDPPLVCMLAAFGVVHMRGSCLMRSIRSECLAVYEKL